MGRFSVVLFVLVGSVYICWSVEQAARRAATLGREALLGATTDCLFWSVHFGKLLVGATFRSTFRSCYIQVLILRYTKRFEDFEGVNGLIQSIGTMLQGN